MILEICELNEEVLGYCSWGLYIEKILISFWMGGTCCQGPIPVANEL